MAKTLGILGGMGPLASAAFVMTIYEANPQRREQEMPICILHSDPTVPDRTKALRSGEVSELRARLVRGLNTLRRMGAERLAVACLTSHALLDDLPRGLRSRFISLVDLIVDEVSVSSGRHLLLCTDGSRQAGVFTRHPRWASVQARVLLPEPEDQNRVHRLIYRQLKRNQCDDQAARLLDALSRKYQVGRFIAGCTEIHLLHRYILGRHRLRRPYQFIDPLMTIARDWRRLCA